jgi:hypothetical protein
MKKLRAIEISVDVLLTVFIALYIITGFGITEYRIIETITFSALSKPVSHLIHSNLIIPFFILLILHVLLSVKINYFRKLFGRYRSKN